MIDNFKFGEYVEKTEYEVRFFYDEDGGFAFQCDKNGKLLEGTNPIAMKNYNWCLKNKNRFAHFNEIVENRYGWMEPNTGTCHCGQNMELINQYMGACKCPKCGQWYNIFGQELNPPETWED